MKIQNLYKNLNTKGVEKYHQIPNKISPLTKNNSNHYASSLSILDTIGRAQINFNGSNIVKQRVFTNCEEFLKKRATLSNKKPFDGTILFEKSEYKKTDPIIITYKNGFAQKVSGIEKNNGDMLALIKSGKVYPTNKEENTEIPPKIFFQDHSSKNSSLTIKYNPKNKKILKIEEQNDQLGIFSMHTFNDDGSFIRKIYTPLGDCHVVKRDPRGIYEKFIINNPIDIKYTS